MSIGIPGHVGDAAAGNQLGALRARGVEQVDHAAAVVGADQRSHLRLGIEATPETDAGDMIGEPFDQRPGDATLEGAQGRDQNDRDQSDDQGVLDEALALFAAIHRVDQLDVLLGNELHWNGSPSSFLGHFALLLAVDRRLA